MSDNNRHISPDEFERKLFEYKERIAELEKLVEEVKMERDNFSQSLASTDIIKRADILYNATNQGIIIRNHEGDIIYANPSASKILGIEKEFLLNFESYEPRINNILPDGSIMTKETHPARIAIITGKEVTNAILGVYNPKKQAYIWINITATPIINKETGLVERVFTIFEDITERLESEKRLKEGEAKAKALLDTIPDLILRISRDGKVIDFHGEQVGLFQKEKSIANLNIRKVFETDLALKFMQFMEEAFDSGKVQVFDIRQDIEGRGVCFFEFRISSSGEREITAIVRDVTEQKRLQRKSIETTRRLTTLMRNLSGMAYRCLADESWTMLYVSHGVVNLTGYTPEELNYNTHIAYNDIIHPDDQKYVADAVYEGSVKNKRFSIEYRIISKDGALKWVFEQGITVKDKMNQPLFIEGYIADITNRKLAEQKLIQSENKFRILFNYLNEAVFVQSWKESNFQKFVEVNDTAIKRYGYSREEFYKLTPSNLSLRDDFSGINEDTIRKALRDKGSISFETNHVTKSGEIFPVVINANLIELNGGKFIQSIVHDLSDRKTSEAKLKHKTEIEQLMIGISADFIGSSIKDVDQLIDLALKNIGEFTNTDRNYVFLINDNGTILNNTNEWCRDGVVSMIEKLKKIPIEDFQSWIKKFQQREHLYLPLSKLSSEDIKKQVGKLHSDLKSLLVLPILSHESLLGFVGFDSVFKDKEWDSEDINLLYTFADVLAGVISRRNFEQKLIFAKEKAEESDQLKSTFLASMSHELRTPLNAIIGFSGLINSNSPIDKIEKWNEIVKSSGQHLLKIIESIFDVSLFQAKEAKIKMDEFSLADLFLILKQYVKAELKKSNKTNLITRLECTPNDDNLYLKSDKTKLIQLLTNLLNNAIKYTKSGKITYGYRVEESDITFYVSDTGIGILPEHTKVIFDIFRQIDEPSFGMQSGVGLGLAICKEISKLLDGELWLSSEKNKGTSFYFRLRGVVHLQLGEIEATGKRFSPPLLRDKTILVVEDIEFNYLLIDEILAPTLVKVIWARNGEEAVRIIEANTPVDLILMDIKMPVMNGYNASKQIINVNPNIPIIAQTAYALKGDRKKISELGFKGYISKPIDKVVLYQILYEFLQPNVVFKD
ncbi:MAG: PAS domain S-box protein [Labilibaculum antarcticum]